MVQSLPGFLNLCLDVCSPSQVLGDVYTEVLEASGVVVPGEVGILLIYGPNFFFFKGPAKDERPVSNSDM